MRILDVAKLRAEHAKLQKKKKRDEDDTDRLKALSDLFDHLWSGATALISDDGFEDFARDDAESVTGIDMSQWPFDHIDWEAAAISLQQDYKPIDFDGETWWYHA